VAGVGGMIGGLAVCAAATAGGPLLEALDVSEPSFRLAAGIVAGLAGAADCSGDHPRPNRRSPTGARRSSRSRSP
jgi:small neutral amino acid transporter SnatA (MarC family)